MLLIMDAILVIFLLGLSRKITSQIQIAESFRRCRCQKEENEEEESAENLFFLIFSWLLFLVSVTYIMAYGFSLEPIPLIFSFQSLLGLGGLICFSRKKKITKIALSEYGFRAIFAATVISGVFLALLLALFFWK